MMTRSIANTDSFPHILHAEDDAVYEVPARQVVVLEDRGESRTPLCLRGDAASPGGRGLIERR